MPVFRSARLRAILASAAALVIGSVIFAASPASAASAGILDIHVYYKPYGGTSYYVADGDFVQASTIGPPNGSLYVYDGVTNAHGVVRLTVAPGDYHVKASGYRWTSIIDHYNCSATCYPVYKSVRLHYAACVDTSVGFGATRIIYMYEKYGDCL